MSFNYSKNFFKLRNKLNVLKEQLKKVQDQFKEECPHVDLSGRSTFPNGISFTNCTICGLSNYSLGKQKRDMKEIKE